MHMSRKKLYSLGSVSAQIHVALSHLDRSPEDIGQCQGETLRISVRGSFDVVERDTVFPPGTRSASGH